VSFSLRLFVAVLLLVAVAVWISVVNLRSELVPGMRQSLEEVLVDTANLLAVAVSDELANGTIEEGSFARDMEVFGRRRFNAVIYELKKEDPSLVVYVTDAEGIVLYDSRGSDVGADYSQWNDVYNTLRGHYGARSTRVDPHDESSSVMYVAAPVMNGEELIGVLSVGKPSNVVTPFLDAARKAVFTKSAGLLALAIVMAAVLSWRMTRSVRKLTRYADAVGHDRRVVVPRLREPDLKRLSAAMESMRQELEGKRYVEKYLHALTHELKSPLAAISGAAELLDEEMPAEDRRRFMANIRSESSRLHEVLERLLQLAALEGRTGLERTEVFATGPLVEELCEDKLGRMVARELEWDRRVESVEIDGEPFLVRQAISSLMDNAIEFSPRGGRIDVKSRRAGGSWEFSVRDRGPGIPDYAQGHLYERFYSLPRPNGGAKSTGLGLTAAREVAELHGGAIKVENHPDGGAVATLRLPARR
jgi:two-component system sensor histidine kinase CreC